MSLTLFPEDNLPHTPCIRTTSIRMRSRQPCANGWHTTQSVRRIASQTCLRRCVAHAAFLPLELLIGSRTTEARDQLAAGDGGL